MKIVLDNASEQATYYFWLHTCIVWLCEQVTCHRSSMHCLSFLSSVSPTTFPQMECIKPFANIHTYRRQRQKVKTEERCLFVQRGHHLCGFCMSQLVFCLSSATLCRFCFCWFHTLQTDLWYIVCHLIYSFRCASEEVTLFRYHWIIQGSIITIISMCLPFSKMNISITISLAEWRARWWRRKWRKMNSRGCWMYLHQMINKHNLFSTKRISTNCYVCCVNTKYLAPTTDYSWTVWSHKFVISVTEQNCRKRFLVDCFVSYVIIGIQCE